MNTIINIIRSIQQDLLLFITIAGMVLYSGFRTLSATKPQALLMPVINVQGSTVNAYTAFKKNNDIIKSQRAEYYPGFITINTGTYIKSAIDLSTK